MLLIDMRLCYKISIYLLSLLTSCSQISRIEHGRSDIFLPDINLNNQYVFVEHGIRLQKEDISLDLMVGPIAQWSDNQDYEIGTNINPRIFWFFDKSSFLHLEADFSIYDDYESVFTFLALEKVWK